MLKKIETLVQTQGHLVLATCGPDAKAGQAGQGGAPHASLMSFCAAPDCSEFWLATQTQTRKFRNLSANPRASLLLDDRAPGDTGSAGGDPGLALSVDVKVEPFETAANEARARRSLLSKHPQLASFVDQSDVRVLRLVAGSFQLLSGLSDVFFIEAEKMLDARTQRA